MNEATNLSLTTRWGKTITTSLEPILPFMYPLPRPLLLCFLIASTLNAATPQDFAVDIKATLSDSIRARFGAAGL